jgi:hypothetical protein
MAKTVVGIDDVGERLYYIWVETHIHIPRSLHTDSEDDCHGLESQMHLGNARDTKAPNT